MKKSELFTQEMLETFTCHPCAVAPILGGEGVQFELENPLNGCIMLAHITSCYKHVYFE